jgi:glycerate kinase
MRIVIAPEVLAAALDPGARQVILAAGGSASTDAKLRGRTTAGEATAPAGQLLTRMGS